ncbi:TylF/MycF/NovP-related O-methyltransferase [Polymorphobacter multimanifer]|uniref:Asparagine synthase (Glutamine-hydrolyzing) n=1 Tax=Polymorphobacter multimanifer TaxID=1070431 RepID=A0A841L1X1_9SPHN|nr:TylF/MycF/NovP-related O-methyltransferase [Polymorphobacter multimanifer]MBB6226420.1 asparagine synthase (glutamine-hydrolyzing) [Polymorphobacter multimanifer]
MLRLAPITRAVLAERLTYLSLAKLERIEYALRAVKNVPGAVVEFGVAMGGSGIILASHCVDHARFVGFDVFAMIPPPTSEKDDAKSKARYETIRSGQSRGIGDDEYYGYRSDLLADVTSAFARHGVPVDGQRVQLVKGLFEHSWAGAAPDRIALVHIDCDWYDPVKFCLEAVADRLSAGGIIVIDDYNDYGGCRVAVDEFVGKRVDYRMEPGANPFLRRQAVA